jgi:polyisoprenoid-binding protein YceI
MIRLLLFMLLTSTLPSVAQEYGAQAGKVQFLSKAPLSEFTGESKTLKGLINLDKNLVDFFVDLNTLNTGISLRDKHMRENYLETKKFPFAEFTGKFETIPLLKPTFQNVHVKGYFKLHGITKEVRITGEIRQLSSGELELRADWIISLEDYQIEVPKLVFYELATEQQINIDVIMNPKK